MIHAVGFFFGAEACTSITVGGVADKDSIISVAKKGQPSPFTRRGDVEVIGRYKPDVVASAGNVELNSQLGSIQKNNATLGVTSLALSPNTLACDVGTSYSTPVIANMLAKLSEKFPAAGPNLLKALLIHFAQLPEQHWMLNMGDGLKRSVYGKGMPDFNKCAYSTTSCATYILEDFIGYDEIRWIPIYVPKMMKNIYGEKRMRVTLVYNPPVDRGVLSYNLIDLDFNLYKSNRIQRNWDNIYRRRWDNVKTDVFRWQKLGWGKEWIIMVFPRLSCKKKISHEYSNQKYALVVSLEDPSRQINIYDAILSETKTVIPLEAYIQTLQVPRTKD